MIPQCRRRILRRCGAATGYHAAMALPNDAVASIDPPEAGSWVELDAGVIWSRLPVPGVLGHINVWLLPAPGGWWLADSGMFIPAVEAGWAALEAALGLSGRLLGIIVTHHHPDHIGMAAQLASRHGVAVRCSENCWRAASKALQPPEATAATDYDGWAAAHGVAADPALRELMTGEVYRHMISGLPEPAAALYDGERLHLDADWGVSLHEGHAPGHACFFNAADGLLISGDQILTTISPNISLHPANRDDDPLGQYLASLVELRRLPANAYVLPAHGRPFRRLHGRIDELVAEHENRLARIEEALVVPLPLDDVVTLLFRIRVTDAFNRMLALGESLAHLRYLEVRGRIRRDGWGPDLRWRRC